MRFLLGTWFFEIGFILYPPTDALAFQWNHDDHNQIMIVTGTLRFRFNLINIKTVFLKIYKNKVHFAGI